MHLTSLPPSLPPSCPHLENLAQLLHAHIPRGQQATAYLPLGLVVRGPLVGAGSDDDLHLDQFRLEEGKGGGEGSGGWNRVPVSFALQDRMCLVMNGD